MNVNYKIFINHNSKIRSILISFLKDPECDYILHRIHGPSKIVFYYKDSLMSAWGGAESWWYKDKLHRRDGPAIIYLSGYKKWYKNGKFIFEQINI